MTIAWYVRLRDRPRTSGEPSPRPFAAWPTDTFFGDDKELFFNDEAIQLIYQPGHTDGDVLVFFRRSDVVASGDLFQTTTYPVIDVARGGTIQGEIAALNTLSELAVSSVPIVTREEGTLIVSGHGRVYDQLDVVEYRDMVTIVRDRIKDMVQRGLTLAQVKAARPTLDFDGRYGSTTGAWTTSMFIEAVYKTL